MSPGVDTVPSQLIKNGGKGTATVLAAICQKIWETKEWPKEWTQSLVIPYPKMGNLKQCQNYRTISLTSYPSKIMLPLIPNRLKAKTDELLAEKQSSDFRPGRSRVEQVFNSRVNMQKHQQHERDLLHNFKNFKTAIDRVWHAGCGRSSEAST